MENLMGLGIFFLGLGILLLSFGFFGLLMYIKRRNKKLKSIKEAVTYNSNPSLSSSL